MRARRRLGPVFAVDYACRKSLAFLGVVGLGMLVQATLGAALQFLLDFQALAGVVHSLGLEVTDAEASIVAFDLAGDAELAPFWGIDHLTTVAHLLGRLPSAEARPLRIELAGLLSEEIRRRIVQHLGCAVIDAADRSRLVYGRKALESRCVPDRAGAAIWRHAAERELAALPQPDARSRVQRLVSAEGRLVGRREVSKELGVSERSLDRLLAREGVRFSELGETRQLSAQRPYCAWAEPSRRSPKRSAIPTRAVSGDAFAPAVAALTLGLVRKDQLARRLGRNSAFDHGGNIAIALVAGGVGYLFSQRVVFLMVPLFAALTSAAALMIPADAIDHDRARDLGKDGQDRRRGGRIRRPFPHPSAHDLRRLGASLSLRQRAASAAGRAEARAPVPQGGDGDAVLLHGRRPGRDAADRDLGRPQRGRLGPAADLSHRLRRAADPRRALHL